MPTSLLFSHSCVFQIISTVYDMIYNCILQGGRRDIYCGTKDEDILIRHHSSMKRGSQGGTRSIGNTF
jgi:hypothetical protein